MTGDWDPYAGEGALEHVRAIIGRLERAEVYPLSLRRDHTLAAFKAVVEVAEAARAVTKITHAGATGARAWHRLKKAVAALDAGEGGDEKG